MSTVITVKNLGKKYTISHQQREEYFSLRDALTNSVATFGKRLIRPFRKSLDPQTPPRIPDSEDFWALKDVSFEVNQGERIGIIGKNGAGKSTLLKILSRITEPTVGSIRIRGRVASLLEVGTGFHPELTGRENVFLNGAILGMHRDEIRRKFDEIVDFAGIDKFLDTPVKRYSSGMYVRLAFAVAAHLEPEILIVDEVLAVGDAQFQKKCMGKMENVGSEGRTVLFVSHNISAINSLCTQALLIKNGSVDFYGDTNEVTNKYIEGLSSELSGQNGAFDLSNRINTYNNGEPVIVKISVFDHNGQPSNTVVMGKTAKIQFELHESADLRSVDFGIGFYTPDGFRVSSVATWSNDVTNLHNSEKGSFVLFEFDQVPFTAGKIMMSPSISNSKLGLIYDHPEMSCSIDVVEDNNINKKKISRTFGAIIIDGKWQI